MKKYYSHYGIITMTWIVLNSWTYKLDAQASASTATTMSASEMTSNNTRLFNEFTNQAQIEKSYRAGLITKGEAMQASVLNENRKSMNIYGKVVDQNGNPIAGVEVTGGIAIRQGWYADDKWEKYKTLTDTNGLFQFTGLKGADWSVDIQKKGYEMDYRRGWAGPRGGPQGTRTSPDNRAILTMWKSQGTEPMIHVEIGSGIACDETPTRFGLLTGMKSTDGNLIVSLTRNPVNIDRRKPFNWSVTLEIPNGGFEEITNLYPYEAPAEGYQTTLFLNFPTNATGWVPEFRHSYYFKIGNDYGRVTFDIYGNFQPPPTYFGAEIYINPAGSRNLEFDYKKQIR